MIQKQIGSAAPGKKRRFPVPGMMLLLVFSLTGGCASQRHPDLATLYHEQASQRAGRPPLVGIPGLMGSRIIDPRSGEDIWGCLRGVVSGTADMRLALPVESGDDMPPMRHEAILEIGGVDIYQSGVKVLVEDGGYTMVTEQNPAPQAPLFPFGYDWRFSCATNAETLSALITSIQQRCKDPSAKVDILTHSMGGLIARYYILYGGKNVLNERNPVPTYAGAANVRKLVMIGTPNMGSAGALLALLEGSHVGLARIHPDLVATMPSMVELIPPPSVPALFLPDGSPAPIDIYDVTTWKETEWGIFDPARAPGIMRRYESSHRGATEIESAKYLRALQEHFGTLLAQAAAFHRALEAGPVPASVQTLAVGGDCARTLRGFVVEREKGRWKVRRTPGDVKNPIKGVDLSHIYYDPGDGVVTKSSLLAEGKDRMSGEPTTFLPYAVPGFICEQHRQIGKNMTFRDNLLGFLLYEPRPSVAPAN